MVRLGKDQTNWLLAVVTLVALVAMVFILARVESSYRHEINLSVEAATRAFEQSGALKSPRDMQVDFDRIADLSERAEASSRVRRVYVAKYVGDRPDPTLLHPFYYALAHPDWRERFEDLDERPLRIDGEAAGMLYFDLDRGALAGVQISMAVVALLIVVVIAALVLRIFSQERTLTATNEVLEENQRELIRTERLALAGLLTANILHDIRKPVTNIKHELADLSEALGGFAGATRALRNMRDQVVLFFDILRDLNLERFVRSDEADEEYVDVNRVAEQALRLVQYERGGTQLVLHLAPGLPLVLAHPYRLIQVVSNLVLNAYQALEGHGEITVRTWAAIDEKGTPVPDQTEETTAMYIGIEIADTGPGIPPELLPQLFEPFFTTRANEQGSGLGLYISRTIVEELDGTINVTSQLDQGTRFLVVLPASD